MTGKIDPHQELRIRFSVAGIIIAVTVCGMVFALLRTLGPLAAMMATLLLAAVASHVAASYLGHRLGIGRPRHLRTPEGDGSRTGPPLAKSRPRSGPNLAERSAVSRWQVKMIAQVSITGAVSGGILSARLPAEEFTYAALALSMLSGAALGGMATWLLVSFGEHAWRSIRAAATEL